MIVFPRPFFRSLALLLCALSSTAFAADRPKVGLVLGGGGARGAAHIGVLEELERLRIPVDCVAGTSMGALVAGAWAAGLDAAAVKALFTRQRGGGHRRRPGHTTRRCLGSKDQTVF